MSRSQLEFKPEAGDSDLGVMMMETGVEALGPEDHPAGSGDETQSHSWALGTMAFASPRGEGPAKCTGAPQGWGEAECGLLEAEGRRGLRESKPWPASH